MLNCVCEQNVIYTKEVIKSHKTKKDRQHNDTKKRDKKDKHWSTKHYTKPTENLSHMVIKKHRVFNVKK